MNTIYCCLGSNMGDRASLLHQAIDRISSQIGTVEQISSLYETQARGAQDHHPYLNVCIKVSTDNGPHEALHQALTIESMMGRVRTDLNIYEPRPIDIDLLFCNNEIINSSNLIIPHPRLHLRKFVLIPLCEIAPDLIHPLLHKTISQLLDECTDQGEVTLMKQNKQIYV